MAVAKVLSYGKRSRAVIIPWKWCRELGLHAGDIVQLSLQGACVVVQPMTLPVPPTVTTSPAQEASAE